MRSNSTIAKRLASQMWGRPDHQHKLADGIWEFSTPRHGGIIVDIEVRPLLREYVTEVTLYRKYTDGDKKLLEALPTEVLINDEDLQHYIDPDSDCDAKMDAVSDYLTDTYGYCHKGFDTCILPSEEELNLLDIIESALALQGYDVMDANGNTYIVRSAKDDLDFEIRVQTIAN